MLETKRVTFTTHTDDLSNLLNGLYRWNVTPEQKEDCLEFSIQANNIVYEITILVFEWLNEEEQASSLTAFPFIKTFGDIQQRIFGKEIFNWR